MRNIFDKDDERDRQSPSGPGPENPGDDPNERNTTTIVPPESPPDDPNEGGGRD